VPPREAFYQPKKSVLLANAVGEIAGEMLMAYPPGIPVISLGERITQEIVDYIKLLKIQNCQLQGMADSHADTLMVLV
ncbi:MAG: arginine decarboxylase, partial [Hyphomonadaceae bacterium]|nr:arginine decarboxylase [Clostridia bacterium]